MTAWAVYSVKYDIHIIVKYNRIMVETYNENGNKCLNRVFPTTLSY